MASPTTKPPGTNAGTDPARYKPTLNQSKIQQSNNALYQTIKGLIDSASDFQGFIQAQYNILSGSLSSLYTQLFDVINDLSFIRNNSRYGSMFQGSPQTVPDSVDTYLEWDIVIFDEGLYQDPTDNTKFIIPYPAQYQVQVQLVSEHIDDVFMSIQVNGSNVVAQGPTSGITGMFPALKNDVVQIQMFQATGGDLDVEELSLQIFRVSYDGFLKSTQPNA